MTGALLLLDFANRTVVNFANFPRVISQSNATLDLIQPLLRGGGRAVTLEPLTQSERDLLYQVRSYARFRKEFYVSIAGGGGGSITGGVFVPSGVVITSVVRPGAGLGASGLSPGNIPAVPLSGVGPQVNRVSATLPVARGPGPRPGAVRADLEHAVAIRPRDRPTTRADRRHVDRRCDR